MEGRRKKKAEFMGRANKKLGSNAPHKVEERTKCRNSEGKNHFYSSSFQKNSIDESNGKASEWTRIKVNKMLS